MESWPKVKEYDKDGEESVTHARVFEEIDIPPESSDKKSNISYNSEYSIDCNYKFFCIWGAFKASHYDSIILVGEWISINTGIMRIVDDSKLNYALVNLIISFFVFNLGMNSL